MNKGDYIQFEIGSDALVNYYRTIIGISYTPSGKDFGMDFNWYISGTTGEYQLYTAGVGRTRYITPYTIQKGNRYKIWRNNGNVEFYINDMLNRSFPDMYPDRPMYLEAVFGDPNKKVENLYIYKEVVETTHLVAKGDYRYGFNGQEKEREITSGTYSAEFWMYESRLARRWNLDPRPNVSISSYAAFANNPILFADPLGDTIRFVSDGKVLITDYTKTINDLKKSKLFSHIFDYVNSQSEDYYITIDEGLITFGQNDFGNKTITLRALNDYVLAQELFHAYQSFIGVYNKKQDHSVIEAEGDLMSEYISNETYMGYGMMFIDQGEPGGWAEKILEINGDRYENPTNAQVQSSEYVELFKEAVNKRIEYFKKEGLEYERYTTPNSGKGPEAIQRVFNEVYGEEEK